MAHPIGDGLRRGRARRGFAWLCGALGLLPLLAAAPARDPLWVLLSDNAEIGLPRFQTGATYTCEPAASAPAELSAEAIASRQGGGIGRLQDAGRPDNSDAAALGWKERRATVTFDLKRAYRIEAVELLLVAEAAPELIRVECRASDTGEWKTAATRRDPAGTGRFWQLIDFEAPVPAARVRVVLESPRARLLLREARIWGRLDEPDPAALAPAAEEISDRPLALVEAGRARSVIVVGADPTPKATAAARLLQDMLFRMTGALLPVAGGFSRADVPRILVGPGAAAEAGIAIPQTYPENEHILLRRRGRDLVLVGNDASPDPNGEPDAASVLGRPRGHGPDPSGFHGTMTAVCAFLELHGARFFRWDDVDNYLVLPRRTDIRVDALDRTERPAFVRRSISARVGTYAPSRDLWRIWNRIGGVHMSYAHNKLVTPADYAAHPEYFAMIDGRRVDPGTDPKWQVCTSNPGVVRLASDLAAKQFSASPSLRSYSLSARDNVSFCECASCLAQPGNASDRWVAFANAVRAEFERRHPEFADRIFVFYAYWGLSSPPERAKLAPGVHAMFIGDGCHAHTWESPHAACANHAMLAKFAGWQAASPAAPVSIYDWYIPATGTGVRSLQWREFPWFVHTKPFADARTWRREAAPVANVEIDGEFDQLALHWMPYYLLARATWDPSASADATLHDLCVALYGEASGTMENVFRLLDRAMTESDAHGSTWRLPDPRSIYSASRRSEVARLLEQASRETASDPKPHARVLETRDRWGRGWEALERMKLPDETTEMYNPAVGK